MNRIVLVVMALGVLLGVCGCAHNSLAGDQSTRTGVYFGDVGIWGSGNQWTVQRGSRLTKVSFFGHQNTVMIEDDVTLPKVEFIGDDNTISVPEYLMFRVTEIGKNNKVIRRQVTWQLGEESERLYVPPPPPAESTTEIEPPPAAEEEQPAEMPETEESGTMDEPLEPGSADGSE
ncbi:MAG: hypothetical protein PVJ57_04085 [Phycisphaerae bacterium]